MMKCESIRLWHSQNGLQSLPWFEGHPKWASTGYKCCVAITESCTEQKMILKKGIPNLREGNSNSNSNSDAQKVMSEMFLTNNPRIKWIEAWHGKAKSTGVTVSRGWLASERQRQRAPTRKQSQHLRKRAMQEKAWNRKWHARDIQTLPSLVWVGRQLLFAPSLNFTVDTFMAPVALLRWWVALTPVSF